MDYPRKLCMKLASLRESNSRGLSALFFLMCFQRKFHRLPLVNFSVQQVTFHEEDWQTWKELARPVREPTGIFFYGDGEQGEQEAVSTQSPAAAKEEVYAHHSSKGNDTREASYTANATATSTTTATATAISANATTTATASPETTPSEHDEKHSSVSIGGRAEEINSSISDSGSGSGESGTTPKDTPGKIPSAASGPPPRYKDSATDQAKIERLCQAIADRVEVRAEGSGGKLELRAPRWREDGHAGANGGRDGEAIQQDGEDDEEGEGGGGREGGSDGGLYGGGGGGSGGLGLGSGDVGNPDHGKVRRVAGVD